MVKNYMYFSEDKTFTNKVNDFKDTEMICSEAE